MNQFNLTFVKSFVEKIQLSVKFCLSWGDRVILEIFNRFTKNF